MHFVWDGVAHHVGMPSGNDEYIRTHPLFQANIHPDRKEYMSFFYKYVNPWSIKTPPGYSSLFIPPMHRDNFIEILPGIVDTDSFTSPVELPFIMSRFEDDILIPAGTPIAQIIPVKRDRWSISFADLSKDSKESRNIVHSRFFDSYKKSMWSKKSYE
jgi:hypothetical protein